MMSFDAFLEAAAERIRKELPGAEVRIRRIDKLQGASYVGITVRPEGAGGAASFNVASAYEQYLKDAGRKDAVLDGVAAEALRAAASLPELDSAELTDYARAREHLVMQVVPAGPNREMLETVPHRIVEDIAVVYRVELAGGTATTLVTDRLLEGYGVTPEQLHEDAAAAQLANHPPVLMNMSAMLAEMTGGGFDLPESPMWVATVGDRFQGASVTQLPGFLEEAAKTLGGDFFILPSSVHEVLFVRDDGTFRREQLEDMVRSVNAAEVSERDFLSDSVYHYDSEARVFEKAVSFELRTAEEPELRAAVPSESTISVLLVEPDRHPRPVGIGTALEDLQRAVGGFIEVAYPFDEPVGLVMNEEGKIDGLPLNRALRDDSGEIRDIVAGPFLVVGLTDDGFCSLTPDQMKSFEEKFHSPEVFVRMGRGILAVPVPDDKVARQPGWEPDGPERRTPGKTKDER